MEQSQALFFMLEAAWPSGQGDGLEIHLYSRFISAHGCHLPTYFSNQVLSLLSSLLEITVSHPTLSDQILKMSGQFHNMIGHDDRTSHQHILTYLHQEVVSQSIMAGPICKLSDQVKDLKGHMSCELTKIISSSDNKDDDDDDNYYYRYLN